jgi:DNA repair protein RadA/Sms
MLLAVLDARCGLSFAQHDVYLNVAGGLRINEPAADLAAAAALVSSFAHTPIPANQVFFGEISLSGSVRAGSHTGLRLKEAQKLGFTHAVLPAAGETGSETTRLTLSRIAQLKELADRLRPCD